jgi:hypothetical protein
MAQVQPNPVSVMRVIVFAFVGLIVLLNVFIASNQPRQEAPSYLFVGIGSIAIIVGFVLSQQWLAPEARVGSSKPLTPPQKFQERMLIAMAFMELGALLSVFAVAHQPTGYAMSGLALAGILIGVYPNVDRYCKAATEQGTK